MKLFKYSFVIQCRDLLFAFRFASLGPPSSFWPSFTNSFHIQLSWPSLPSWSALADFEFSVCSQSFLIYICWATFWECVAYGFI